MRRHMENIMRTIAVGTALSLIAFTSHAAPVSDMAKDLFEKGPILTNPDARSPFVPSIRTAEDLDPTTLIVEGIVYGKGSRWALVSGRIITEGGSIGKFDVSHIGPGEVVLSADATLYHIKMEGSAASEAKNGYLVEFRNASLRDALTLLARSGDFNLIMPEDIAGRVNLAFEDIDLMEVLRSILRVNNYEYAQEGGILRIGKADQFVGGTDLRTKSFHLKYATAKDLVDKYRPLLSDKGSVIADDRTNTLTVKDRDPMIVNIANLISQIDKRDKQVQIEARIVDASRNFSREVGIQWGLSGTKENVKVGGDTTVGTSVNGNPLNVNLGATSPTSGVGLVIGKIAGALDLEAQLTAAEQKGDVHILSKPSVTTLNNMPAKIRSGSKIYVKQSSTVNLGTAQAGQSALQEINTGIELTVTPQISIDNYIKMKIDAMESTPDFSNRTDGIPAINDNTASTTVILKDGETTIIGGLYQERDARQKRGVPGLQNIPVMGHLFKSKSRTSSSSELIIFITPRIFGQ